MALVIACKSVIFEVSPVNEGVITHYPHISNDFPTNNTLLVEATKGFDKFLPFVVSVGSGLNVK